MIAKPDHVFDRDREWAGLTRFAANPHRGVLLGVVSGRRRQGKSFLLEALTSATLTTACSPVTRLVGSARSCKARKRAASLWSR